MLKLRRFVQGEDEEIWVKVRNASFKEVEHERQISAEELREAERAPGFDSEGRFIALLEDRPVGIVHAYVDSNREEKKGFIRSFGIIPEYRGKGLEKKLADKALKELRRRGMKTVQAWAPQSREDIIRLWERFSFKLVRKFSLMKRDLHEIPSEIGENREVVLTPLRKDADEDVRMLNWLDNECFKEHFNHRPTTVEETTFMLRENPFFKYQKWLFAALNDKQVGYVGVGVDEKYNSEKDVKGGWIMDIGVLKAQRRRGIGARLMLEGMRILKTDGMTTALLGVDDWNITNAMRLYEKLGFKVSEKDLTYERTIE